MFLKKTKDEGTPAHPPCFPLGLYKTSRTEFVIGELRNRGFIDKLGFCC